MTEKQTLINTVNTILCIAEKDILEQTGIKMRVIVTVALPEEESERQPHLMLGVIANALGRTPDEFNRITRKPEIVELRQFGCYFLKKYYPQMSLKDIGELICKYDHTTVMYAIKVMDSRIDTEALVQEKHEIILNAITQWMAA